MRIFAILLLSAALAQPGTSQEYSPAGYLPPTGDETASNVPDVHECPPAGVKYVHEVKEEVFTKTVTNTVEEYSTATATVTKTKHEEVRLTQWRDAPVPPAQTVTEYVATVKWHSATVFVTNTIEQQTLADYTTLEVPATGYVYTNAYVGEVETVYQGGWASNVVTENAFVPLTKFSYNVATVTNTIERPVQTSVQQQTSTIVSDKNVVLPAQTITSVVTKTQTLTETRLIQPAAINVEETVTSYTVTTSTQVEHRNTNYTVHNKELVFKEEVQTVPLMHPTYELVNVEQRKVVDNAQVDYHVRYDTVQHTEYTTSQINKDVVVPDQTYTSSAFHKVTVTRDESGLHRVITIVKYNEQGPYTITLTNVQETATITHYINYLDCPTKTYEYAEPTKTRIYE